MQADSKTQNIHARFQLTFTDFTLDTDLTLPGRGVTALFGHSGSGKTTLLRCIAGLESRCCGFLRVGSEVWQDGETKVPTCKRPIGYVFQETSLFPHLTVRRNLEYGLRRIAPNQRKISLDHAVDLLGIDSLLDRMPDRLSGGEKQRIAIARALALSPRLLLMDEPLASLDLKRKQEILPYLERLHREFDIPVLYISHSRDEVARLADHVVVLEQGRVVAEGGVQEVFSRIDLPMHDGEDAGVVLQGMVIAQDEQWHLARLSCAGAELLVRDAGDAVGDQLRVRILARDVSLTRTCHDDSSILNRLPVEISEVVQDQDKAMSLVRAKAGDNYILARLTRRSVDHLKLKPGQQLWAQIKSVAIVR